MRYTVSFPEPHTKYFHITLAIRGITAKVLSLHSPAWIPGSYRIRDYAKDISHLQVSTPDGQSLPWRKVSKSEWVIETKDTRRLTVTYRVYGGDIGVHGAYLDHRYAFWNGSALFLYSQACGDSPIEVKIQAPARWQVVTGLPALTKTVFCAADWDELYDCPVLVSNTHALYTFTVARKPHRIALWRS